MRKDKGNGRRQGEPTFSPVVQGKKMVAWAGMRIGDGKGGET